MCQLQLTQSKEASTEQRVAPSLTASTRDCVSLFRLNRTNYPAEKEVRQMAAMSSSFSRRGRQAITESIFVRPECENNFAHVSDSEPFL